MSEPAQPDPGNVFDGGPPLGLQTRLGLVGPENLHVALRMAGFVVIAWVPLLVLALAEGRFAEAGPAWSFLSDFGSLTRYLVAGPLLLAAEAACIRELGRISVRFASLLSDPRDLPPFVEMLVKLRRWRDAPIAEFAVAVLAFAMSLGAIRGMPMADLPAWHHSLADPGALSMAAWWHAVVSLPLLLMLLLGWLCRLLLWTLFLLKASRFDLNLVAVHPDKSAGLAFIGYSLRAFSLVGMALGAIFAGTIANAAVHGGVPLLNFRYGVGGLAVFVVALFTAPLLTVSLKLAMVWRLGVLRYGELASLLGRHFEREWFDGLQPRRHDDILERGDFSAATDLFQVVDRVHDMSIVPVDLMSIVMLAVATLLPFVPVVLAVVPFQAVLAALTGLLR
jgi:hypothetical protein